MSLNLDNLKTIKFPSPAQWGKWYHQWFGSLVAGFKFKYGQESTEDAVSAAFFKVMFGWDGKGSRFVDRELTEKKWHSLIWWQTKACLSHAIDHDEIEQKYGKAALEECAWCGDSVGFKDTLDEVIESRALAAVLEDLPRVSGLNRKTVEMFNLCYLCEQDPVIVARRFGKKNVSSVYVARFRVEKALRRYGKALFEKKLRYFANVA